jgi:hypothetical protein
MGKKVWLVAPLYERLKKARGQHHIPKGGKSN